MLSANISQHCTMVEIVSKHFCFFSCHSVASSCRRYFIYFYCNVSSKYHLLLAFRRPFLLTCSPLLRISHLQPAVKFVFNLSSFSSYMASQSFCLLPYRLYVSFANKQKSALFLLYFAPSVYISFVLFEFRSPSTLSNFSPLFITIAYSLNKYIEQISIFF
jgi:hypothetical protein